MFDNIFKLKENGTTAKTEIGAGLTTFMTMAYILAVNPSILGAAGMDTSAVLIATCLASFVGSACMALLANLPFALSAGMGLNAFFAYTVVLGFGYTWQEALLAVFIEGVIFIILSLTKVRESIFNAIPLSLKRAVSIGIGLFITFIGLQNAGICVGNSATLVSVVDFTANFSTSGICAVLALLGTLISAVLYIKEVPGAILVGIFITWMLGIVCQLTGLYAVDPASGHFSLLPSLAVTDFSKIGLTFGQCFDVDISRGELLNFAVIVVSLLFVDIFDTLGGLIGIGAKAGMLDERGRMPRVSPALLADAVATTAGAVLGTSTVTTFMESSAGVAAGGRTGLTAMTVALLFLVSMLFAPVFTAIPAFATAPALILIGFLAFCDVAHLKLTKENYLEVIPAFLCIITMPLFYSISEGISFGVISYVFIHICCGRARQLNALLLALAVLFICKYIFL